MKPLYLRMQAFGPYPEVQEIDFSLFADNSLFLIHGPTGSGKTTIFDAMCYALYGKTSGERSGEEMRCQYATDTVLTEVQFSFEFRGRHYRIIRCPSQEKHKKRGAGTTRVPHNVEIWDRTSAKEEEEGTLLADRPRDVETEIEKLIGFEVDQFRQVILLPQGEFRKLLLASSMEREDILEKIFGTWIYSVIQERLKEKVKTIEQGCANQLSRREVLLEATGTGNTDELKGKIKLEMKDLDVQAIKVSGAQKNYESAKELYSKAEETEIFFQERDEADRESKELATRDKRMKADENKLMIATKAATLVDIYKGYQEKQESKLERRTEVTVAKKALDRASRELKSSLDAEAKAKALDAEIKTFSDKLVEYKAMKPRVESLKNLCEKLETAQAALEKLQKKRQDESVQHKELEKTIVRTEARIEEILPIASSVEVLKMKEKEMTTLMEDKQKQWDSEKKLSELTSELAVVKKTREKDERLLDSVRKRLTKSEEAWVTSSACNLADNLEPGKPCPVCGSTKHPAPAKKAVYHVSDDELTKARKNFQKTETAFRDSREKEQALLNKVKRAKDKVQDLSERLGEKAKKSKKELDKQYRALKSDHKQARNAETELSECRKKLSQLKRDLEKTKQDLANAEKDYQSQERDVNKQRTTLDERRSGIPKALQDQEQLEKKTNKIQARLDIMEQKQKLTEKKVREAEKRLAEKKTKLDAALKSMQLGEKLEKKAGKELEQRLRQKGFGSEDEFKSALMEEDTIRVMQSELESYKDQIKLNKSRVKTAKAKTTGLKRPNLRVIEKSLEKMRNAYDSVSKEYGAQEKNLKDLKVNLAQIEKLSRSIDKQEKELQVMGRLSEVANGRNEQRITFQRFVLSSLLDHVTAMANERLRRMSEGRYTLHRAQVTRDLRASGGLDLEVFDSFSGDQRSVKTLSGGEMFLASLSMALGLADVVQSYSGGIHLDSIFIDEGFGSLDSETLDHAIETLVALRTGGRLVGVISHVPELRERIEARLEVKPTNHGSVVRPVGV